MEIDPAHDVTHQKRVERNAHRIAKFEGGDPAVLSAAAELHDIGNLPKGHPEAHLSAERSAKLAVERLKSRGFEPSKLPLVEDAILCHSFSAGRTPRTLEGKVFQDADRLDALGVVGMMRCFAITGRIGRGLYHPDDPFFELERELDDKSWGLDHFFRKLFQLPEKMQTNTGRNLGLERVEVMKRMLEQLRLEI